MGERKGGKEEGGRREGKNDREEVGKEVVRRKRSCKGG